MSSVRAAAAQQAKHGLLIQELKKLHPYVQDFKKEIGFRDMQQAKPPIGTSFKVPPNAKISTPVLPEKIWGATVMFKLDPQEFSEFELRKDPKISSGDVMHELSKSLGDGPTFVMVGGNSDVVHVDCLPERRGHDTVDWAPHLGDGTIKIIQEGPIGEPYLVVDVSSLPHADRAYENLFGAGKPKQEASTVSAHYVNTILETTAIRNACKVAMKFGNLCGIKFSDYTRDLYGKDTEALLPEPCAISIDRPLISTHQAGQRIVVVASGMRSPSSSNCLPIVVSPGKLHTFVSDGLVSSTVQIPAYFSLNKTGTKSSGVQISQTNFHKERLFYPGKSNQPTEVAMSKLLPEENLQEYLQCASKACKKPLNSLHSAAVFTL